MVYYFFKKRHLSIHVQAGLGGVEAYRRIWVTEPVLHVLYACILILAAVKVLMGLSACFCRC
jgi:hypothetical protein